MNKIAFVFRLILGKLRPLIGNTVFFDSFHGQYNDNPRYISEKLHELDPTVRIVWCVSGKGKDAPPDYARLVRFDTAEYYRYAFNAAVTVDNNIGLKTLGFGNHDWAPLRWLLKKKGQLCISTWHGTPIKRVGKDQIKCKSRTYYTSTDHLASGSDYNTGILADAFYIPRDRVLPCGMPRTDPLFRQVEREEMLKRLELPAGKRIALYAPTFRESVEASGLQQLRELDIPRLLAVLGERFGGEFVLVFRAHHTVALALEREKQAFPAVCDGNRHDDMADYLSVADVLITDYSGSVFDFALTGKPCFLYAPDFEHYSRVERGLYIDYHSLPFPISADREELYRQIAAFDEGSYRDGVGRWMQSIGNCETGEASEKLALRILEHLK